MPNIRNARCEVSYVEGRKRKQALTRHAKQLTGENLREEKLERVLMYMLLAQHDVRLR